jgi:dTDP-4-dehydrorhamnose 3,5-epimerase
MNLLETELPGVVIIQPHAFDDARGSFMEIWQQAKYAELGLPEGFVQDNVSRSTKGVLRGLHYQYPREQGKLVHVLDGEVFDVAVDVRHGSPNFGRWIGVNLSAYNRRQLYIPPGFAHGFCVLSGAAVLFYKCTDFYFPADEVCVNWSDPDIDIRWPVAQPLLSDKDRFAPMLKEIPSYRTPIYSGQVPLRTS